LFFSSQTARLNATVLLPDPPLRFAIIVIIVSLLSP
jgi:hypothetical protein